MKFFLIIKEKITLLEVWMSCIGVMTETFHRTLHAKNRAALAYSLTIGKLLSYDHWILSFLKNQAPLCFSKGHCFFMLPEKVWSFCCWSAKGIALFFYHWLAKGQVSNCVFTRRGGGGWEKHNLLKVRKNKCPEVQNISIKVTMI